MADNTTQESILFEVKINSQQYQAEQKLIRDSLGQVTLDLEKTRAAQKALNKERDAGKLSDEQFSQQSVKLREQLRGQLADQRELEKGLHLSQQAYNAAAGSADQLKAQLFELRTAYYAMSEAERQSAEGQAIQKQALAVNEALKNVELLTGSAARNVGNYAASFKQGLAGIVVELAKVTAAQKGVDAASEQGQRLQQQRIGFMTAAQRAAAQAGITDFSQAQATIEQYSQALTPAAENLVRLQQEQQQVGQTAGEASQEYQALGFRIAGAEKQLTDLVAAQQAAEQASRAGGAAAQGQAGAVEVAANSLAGLRQQLLALKAQRENLDPTTKEAEELNTQILTLDTRIQQAAGRIDEFGERVQRNIRKENFDTVSDAIQGLTGATALATVVFGDNADAAKAQAQALQLMTIAQAARSIAIGIGSAKEAGLVVLMQARNLFLKEEATLTAAATVGTETHASMAGADAAAIEAQAAAAAFNAEAQGAGAAATVGSTVATEAQVVATESATLAQRALNLAMKLNPIGLIIIAITALVGLFTVYRNSSEQTQQKVKNFAETLLRFTTPIGLVYTAIEKLYQKFAVVRSVLDPLINTFNKVAGAVGTQLHSFGEYIGLLDTAAEKTAKLAAAELERATALREQADGEIKLLEATGATSRAVTEQKLAEIAKQMKAAEANDRAQQALHKQDLQRIAALDAAHKDLSDKDKKILKEVADATKLVTDLRTQQASVVAEGVERDRAARQQEAADIQTNAQRAVQNLARRIEQQDAAENAQLQRNISRIALRLAAVQKGSAEELHLQQQLVQAQAALEIKQTTDVLAEKTRLRALGYNKELAGLKQEQQQALNAQGLTEQQKTAIAANYVQKRADLEEKYSLAAARRAVATIPLLRAQANAAQLKLEADFVRQEGILTLQSQIEQNKVRLAQAKEGSLDRLALESKLIDQEEQAAIAALDRRAMSDLDYQTKVTAIGADAVAKRKAQGEQETQDVIAQLSEEQRGAELHQQQLLAGLTESQQLRVRASEQYHNELLRAELNSYTAGLEATKKGTTARENVEKQHALNLKAIEADTSAAQVALVKDKYDKIAAMASQSLGAISTFQDAATQEQLNRISKEMNAEGTSQARRAVLAKQQERLEQQAHERKQKFAKAQAVIDLGSAIMSILAQTPKFDFGVMTGIQIALATVTAAAQFRAIDAQKFSTGGLVFGPGGPKDDKVPAWLSNGEAVMSAGAVKRFGGLLSRLNVEGGGRPFYVDPLEGSSLLAKYAQGGIVRYDPSYMDALRSPTQVVINAPAPAIDYEALADALSSRLTPALAAAYTALPPQNVNLTELRERNRQLDQRDAETNISA